MRRKLKKIAQLALGYLLLALGIAGLFLPILQGILLIMLGLLVLSWHAPWAERLLHRLRDRFPRQHALMHDWAHWGRERWHAWWHGQAAAPGCKGGCKNEPAGDPPDD